MDPHGSALGIEPNARKHYKGGPSRERERGFTGIEVGCLLLIAIIVLLICIQSCPKPPPPPVTEVWTVSVSDQGVVTVKDGQHKPVGPLMQVRFSNPAEPFDAGSIGFGGRPLLSVVISRFRNVYNLHSAQTQTQIQVEGDTDRAFKAIPDQSGNLEIRIPDEFWKVIAATVSLSEKREPVFVSEDPDISEAELPRFLMKLPSALPEPLLDGKRILVIVVDHSDKYIFDMETKRYLFSLDPLLRASSGSVQRGSASRVDIALP